MPRISIDTVVAWLESLGVLPERAQQIGAVFAQETMAAYLRAGAPYGRTLEGLNRWLAEQDDDSPEEPNAENR